MAHNEKLMFIALEAANVVGGLPIQFYSIRLSHDKMYLQADFTEEAKRTIEQTWPNANWHYEDRHHWWVALAEITTKKGSVLCEITLCL